MSDIKNIIAAMDVEIDATEAWTKTLTDLDFFVLDNSIRESTVGQLRGHTIENKKAIFEISRSLDLSGIIVASFNHMHRVDDEFCAWIRDESGADYDKLWSFSEVFAGPTVDGVPSTDVQPDALPKNKEFGLYNTVFEFDLADPNIEWDTKWTVDNMCALIEKRMNFVYDEINPKAKIVFNLRDLPTSITVAPERVLSVIAHLGRMPANKRPFGIVYEDPLGESLPAEFAAWTRAIRATMNSVGWTNARLLNHIHEKWDLQTATTLECLAAGGDGVWASVCTEGAAMGHASSTVTMTNLVRLGNKKVTESMKCEKFRQAAIDVTKLTINREPHPKQVVYGARALDLVFGFIGVGDFNLGDFFGERTTNRITTLATPDMIVDRMTFLFGADKQFTPEIAEKMRVQMLADLNSTPPRKEEYHSPMGIAMLFDRCGGKMTGKMSEAVSAVEVNNLHHEEMIAEIRAEWDNWDVRERGKNDNMLKFDSFYHGFLQPYFGCYRCIDTKKAIKALDMDTDGMVDWAEFELYLKWALRQYPKLETADQVVEVAFTKGLMPASMDVQVREARKHFRQHGKHDRRHGRHRHGRGHRHRHANMGF